MLSVSVAEFRRDAVPAGTRRSERCEPGGSGLAESLIEFWIRGRNAAGLPDRAHFDVLNLRPWLGHLSIYESVGRHADFLNRLEGGKVVGLTGENWEGHLASDIDGCFDGGFQADLREVAVWRHPKRSICPVFQKPFQVAERVLLPVTVEGTEVDQIFMAMFPRDREATSGRR